MLKDTENTILRVCLQMSGQALNPIPETVILGFSKLLLMDEAPLKTLLPESDILALEETRKIVAEKKLNIKLIKSGFRYLIPYITWNEKRKASAEAFFSYLDSVKADTKAAEIFTKALDSSVVPVGEVFSEDKSMEDVFSYQKKLKDELNSNKTEKSEREDVKETENNDSGAEPKESPDAPEAKSESSKEPADQTIHIEDESTGVPDESDSPTNDRFSNILPLGKDFQPGQLGKPDTDSDDYAAGSSYEPDSINGNSNNDQSDTRGEAGSQKAEGVNSAQNILPKTLEEYTTRYINLSSALLNVVKGQDQAVKQFIDGFFNGDLCAQTENGEHPKSYFFFFGPPGTGKTLLAETAAKALELPYRKYDMCDYSMPGSEDVLTGTSNIYRNTKDGDLTMFVKNNPKCLLIFDEIEKASITVIRLFLTILGSGYLKSKNSNQNISFKDAVIIFTSNVGKKLYEDKSVNLTNLPHKVLIDAIRNETNAYGNPALPNELCSRIAAGNAILFNHISLRHLAEMANDNFEKAVQNMEMEYNCKITYSNQLPLLFLFNKGSEIDARIASGQSGAFLKNEIIELIKQLSNAREKTAITSINLDIEWSTLDPQLKPLFINDGKSEVLVLSGNDKLRTFECLSDKYTFYFAESAEKATDYMVNDLSAIFIDPFVGEPCDNTGILSLTDYNTDGIKFFHEATGKWNNVPVFIIEGNKPFSEIDRRTLLVEGATGILEFNPDNTESMLRQFNQIMDELYMENQSQEFTQRGFVIDFNTKQDIVDNEHVNILFYDLKKRMAVDMDSRSSILNEAERPDVKFDEVIGAKQAKEELQTFVKYLKNPRQFIKNGICPPKGVLLYGPPGTGKTMLARAMAGESDVNFLQTSATEFMNPYVGESEANIRKLFEKAKKYAPSIIFIDEIDAIGKKRTGGESGRHTEHMLNALLTSMDGFASGNSSKPVFVLAATNFGVGRKTDELDGLDEALLRRFDNRIYVDLPKEEERKEYITRLLKKHDAPDVSEDVINNIADRTTGQSLAILQNITNLAIRNAGREGHKLNGKDLLKALEEYNFGMKKEHSPEYYKEVAIHETGHAYLSYIAGDKPSYITIESRGNFGGYMQHANSEEVTEYTRTELLNRIRTALGGRAAEEVFFGKEKSLNTGASSDLRQATELAWQILCTYGMADNQLVVLQKDDILKSSMATEYIGKINDILKDEMNKAIGIIEENKEKIKSISDVLAKENCLTGAQFEELMKGN